MMYGKKQILESITYHNVCVRPPPSGPCSLHAHKRIYYGNGGTPDCGTGPSMHERYRIRYLLCNNQRVQEVLDHGEFCDSGYDMVCVHYPKFTPKLFI